MKLTQEQSSEAVERVFFQEISTEVPDSSGLSKVEPVLDPTSLPA
jgi:hypothetical protein